MRMGEWILVGETRKGLRRWWTVLGGALFLLVFLQTIFGQYSGIEPIAWGWLLFSLLPGFLIVYLSAWLNKNPAKLVAPDTVHGLRVLNVVYLVLLLATIFFSQAAIDRLSLGLDAYLRQSFLWVAPANLMVSTGLGLLFFWNKGFRKPSAAKIQETARSQSRLAATKGYILSQQCLELVAGDDLGNALELLREYFEKQGSTEDRNAIILLQRQFSETNKEREMDLVAPEVTQRTVNRIAVGILNLAAGIAA